MIKSIATVAILCALAAGAAQAQSPGGGHGGRGGRSKTPPDSTSSSTTPSPVTPRAPTSKIQIVGVIQSIEPATDHVVIAYDAVDALNWPAGTKPFEVSKSALLKGATVGEKVRFSLDSQQISALEPFDAGS
jgi:Cu/Ag efflux protein CusF